MPQFRDLTGQQFGRLRAMWPAGHQGRGCVTMWTCQCSDGTIVIAATANLTRGLSKSCGCLQKQRARESRFQHGRSHTPEHWIYCGAIQRCRDSNCKNYSNYGGRGIEFRFKSFAEFFSELGPRPSSKHSLDRINNDGHYEPGNVRWATKSQQALNRRKPWPR